jgi:hypothetical protein
MKTSTDREVIKKCLDATKGVPIYGKTHKISKINSIKIHRWKNNGGTLKQH